ncbi:MAG: hypothetical protein K9L17_03710 [Clostridiales bacterium]|nr:hypothetical protein [Clostridiales bacterium]MCF8021784.1 hypothetical protein [Clostridiales bacterium]
MKNKKFISAVCGLVLGGILLSAGSGLALADSTGNISADKNRVSIHRAQKVIEKFNHGRIQEKLNENLNGLVSEGILTQEQADSIVEFMEQRAQERKGDLEEIKDMTREERQEFSKNNDFRKNGPNLLQELVDNGIISEDEAEAIKEKVVNDRHAKMQEKVNEKLNEFVSEGILTQEQVDSIVEFMEQRSQERKSDLEEIKDMTREERQDFFKNNDFRKNGPNLLQELVDNGIISEDEAEAIKDEFPGSRAQNWDGVKNSRGQHGPGKFGSVPENCRL